MKPKISIVVPIYNVEKYLVRCLDSLLAQSIKSIEIIAVNDGSTDGSSKILDAYASKDERIIVINKENSGVSVSRNVGVQQANGDFIGFVDPDDWVDHSMYESMYNAALEDKADIVMCSYKREFGTHTKEKVFNLPEKIVYKGLDVQTKVMRRLIGPLNEEISNLEALDAWGTVWSKVYRSKLIKGKAISFTDLNEIGTNEDSLFNIEALYHTECFVFLNRPYYHYWRLNTTSLTESYKPSLIEKWSNLYYLIEKFLSDKNMDQDFYTALNNRVSLNVLGLGLNEISKDNKSSVLVKSKNLHGILSDKQVQQSFKQLEMSYFSLEWKLFYYFAKTRNTLGFYCMLISINMLRKVAK